MKDFILAKTWAGVKLAARNPRYSIPIGAALALAGYLSYRAVKMYVEGGLKFLFYALIFFAIFWIYRKITSPGKKK